MPDKFMEICRKENDAKNLQIPHEKHREFRKNEILNQLRRCFYQQIANFAVVI